MTAHSMAAGYRGARGAQVRRVCVMGRLQIEVRRPSSLSGYVGTILSRSAQTQVKLGASQSYVRRPGSTASCFFSGDPRAERRF